MNKFLETKKGYSLAEILIILLVIGIIVLASTPIIAGKGKKKKAKLTHGTYACTVFDGKSYIFRSKKKNAPLPPSKDGWAQSMCGNFFEMPYKSGLLNVKIIGAGGAGGNASADWDDSVAPKTFYDTNTFVVPTSGYYDVIVSGSKGGSSTVSPWEVKIDGILNNCFAEAAKSGDPAYFSGSVYLYKNDRIDIVFEHSSNASLNLSCSSEIETPSAQVGQDGQDIIIKRNSSKMVSVEGSKAGTYICNPANLCGKHLEAEQGAQGTVSTFYSFYDKKIQYGSSPYDPGIVVIRWSDRNNSNKAFKYKAGCGGTSGEIKSALYPILRDKLPAIKISGGGVPGTEPEDTTFGSMRAAAGRNNLVCNTGPAVNDKNGTEGKTFNAVPSLNSKGGEGGISEPSQEINGKNAAGFASGGGGGAIYYYNEPSYDNSKTREENMNPFLNGVQRWYQGSGGKGGSGLMVITW